MMQTRYQQKLAKQSGFTLIEILVTLLVLLIGLLGVAGIQIVSFQNNQGAYLRSQATFIAADFLDRIRTNPLGQEALAYDDIDTNGTIADEDKPSCAIDAAGGCSGEEIAKHDTIDLAAHFTSSPPSLPNGRATVTRDSTSGFDEYIVTVSWNEKAWAGAGGEVIRDGEAVRSVELRTIIK